MNDQFVYFLNLRWLSIKLFYVGLSDNRQFAEYTYQIVVRVSTPEVSVSQCGSNLSLITREFLRALDNQIGSLDNCIMLSPGFCNTLVGTIRIKCIERSTSLLVRTRVGCDIVTLPLWVHRVSPTLCLIHFIVQRINACGVVVFDGIKCVWIQLTLWILIQEIAT